MIQSRWSKVLGILPLVGALAAFSGCNAQGGDGEETAVGAAKIEAQAEAPAKGERRAEHGRGHHGKRGPGPEHLLFAALHHLDLSDAQRSAIEGELEALRGEKGDRADRPDFAAHRAALAAAIRSGKVDEAALQPPAPKEPRDTARVAKAIQTLHDTLSAEQRKELVEVVTAKMEKHGGHHGPKGEMRGPKGEMRGPLGHALRGLELSDEQREKVREALAKTAPREAMRAKHEALRKVMSERLASFAADRFDAGAFVAPPKDAPMFGADMGPAHMVKALAAVVPILDEAQRAELAKRIEQGPPAGEHRGGDHEACPGK